jgi:hypothetical protein
MTHLVFSLGAFMAAHAQLIAAVVMAGLTAAAFSPFVFGNINTAKQGTPQNNRWYQCPSAVTSGMAVLIGTQAAVAMDAYDSSTGGTTFQLDGSYFLTVIAQSSQSPVSGLQVNPGDELYAAGTLDATTGITYSLTIDKTRGNCPFGNYEGPGPILSGATNTSAMVRLKIGGSPGPYAA